MKIRVIMLLLLLFLAACTSDSTRAGQDAEQSLPQPVKSVDYLGVRFEVPADWAVLAEGRPIGCLRYIDRYVVVGEHALFSDVEGQCTELTREKDRMFIHLLKSPLPTTPKVPIGRLSGWTVTRAASEDGAMLGLDSDSQVEAVVLPDQRVEVLFSVIGAAWAEPIKASLRPSP